MKTFETYLLLVGIKSAEFCYLQDDVLNNIGHFRKCFENGMSTYKALTLLSLALKEK